MANGPCRTCRFLRAPAPVRLFSEEDLRNPEVEKVAHEVHEWQRQRQLGEGQRIANRILFEHQPKNFEWCAGYTGQINKFFTRRDARFFHDELLRRKAQGARDVFEQVVGTGQDLKDAADAGDSQAAERLEAIRRDRTDPISGELISYFVPALYVNDDGGCDHWQEGTEG